MKRLSALYPLRLLFVSIVFFICSNVYGQTSKEADFEHYNAFMYEVSFGKSFNSCIARASSMMSSKTAVPHFGIALPASGNTMSFGHQC